MTNPLNAFDRKLISVLARDGRKSSRAISLETGLSPASVRRRRERLLREGTIHIAALAEPERLGFPVTVLIGLDVALDKLQSVADQLTASEHVRFLSMTTGRYDLFAVAMFRSTEELAHFVQHNVANVDGVRGSETFVNLAVYKGKLLPILHQLLEKGLELPPGKAKGE